ncbi:MAG: hypothetical protein WA126_03010 [Thermodesulfovibrionales bacterium]
MKFQSDRRILAAAGIAAIIILCIAVLSISLSSKRELKGLRERQQEMALLREEIVSLKGRVDAVEGKKSLVKVKGIVQAIDEVFEPLGLKQKVKSVKSSGMREIGDSIEEEAEVQVEKIDINEAVNIFYKIENAPMLLSLRKMSMKTSFENPAQLSLTMTIALIKTK